MLHPLLSPPDPPPLPRHSNFLEAVAPESAGGFGFWSPADALFYRDPPSNPRSRRGVFWARGNGWAAGALAAAVEHSKGDDARRGVYAGYLQAMAKRLAALQGADGCWRASLTDTGFNPAPETTGTALYTYALARGIALGVLGAHDYLPAVEAGWQCLATTSLQPSGHVGFCQPVGAGPGRNFDALSTNSFCVGQFLLAASAVAKLSEAA
jgi:unsaturated rhamnogalacturonyl hydrolase